MKIKIFLLLFFFSLILSYIFMPVKRVVIKNNQIVKSNYDFIYEHWKENELRKLYENENFKDIQSNSELDLFLKLCNWTNKQWERGKPTIYPLCNANEILKLIRSKITKGFCGQYAYVLVDVLKALGFYSVRYIELWNEQYSSHFAVEVWSNQFCKWIVLDPYENIYFTDLKNIPLNAFEIQNLDSKDIKIIKIYSKKSLSLKKKVLSYYYYFAVSLRSDLLRHKFPLTVKDRFDMFLAYDKNSIDKHKVNYKLHTRRKEDIYFDCNKVLVNYYIKQNKVYFNLNNLSSCPNFKNFVVSFDELKSWKKIPNNFFVNFSKDSQKIYVSTENFAGRFGVITEIELFN